VASDDKPRILGCTERHPVARAITTRPKALVTPRIHGVCGAGGTRTHDPGIMRPLIRGYSSIYSRLPLRFQGSGPARATAINTVSRHV